jgi:transposase
MDFHLDRLLNFPYATVESCQDMESYVCLKLRLLNDGIICPHCQHCTEHVHQNRPVLVRDLPIFGRGVYLQVPRRQFECDCCGKRTTEPLEFLSAFRRHTKRYEHHIYQRVVATNIEQVCREEELKSDEVKGIFDHISKQHKKKWQPALRLSIDEISMRKGHQNFKTVVSDIDRGKLLEVIDGHTIEKVTEALMQQDSSWREQVQEVSVDMWGGFPKVIEKVFPQAQIVVDRFHVMKKVNEELNKLRKCLGITTKKSKYLLLKNASDLKPEQQGKLEILLIFSPCLRIAYEMKEEFRRIYENTKTVKSAKIKLEKWLKEAHVFYPSVSQTIQKHIQGICNYFINRTTSGVMEGINNKIKLIKRQGYGFTNFDNFRSRLLAAFEYK